MKTITIGNQKGGIGKTTCAWNIAQGLQEQGQKVLLLDADAQCNLSLTAGVDLLGDDKTLYDAMKGTARISDCIHKVNDRLDIIRGSMSLASCDMDFTQIGKEYIIAELLEQIQGDYDYCIIDTPPSLSLMNINSFIASDFLIIPMITDIYVLQGLSQLYGFIERIKKYCNCKVAIAGIFVNMVDHRKNYSKEMLQAIQETADDFGIKVFNTKIRQSVKAGESNYYGKSIYEYASKSDIKNDFTSLVNEIMEL